MFGKKNPSEILNYYIKYLQYVYNFSYLSLDMCSLDIPYFPYQFFICCFFPLYGRKKTMRFKDFKNSNSYSFRGSSFPAF